MPPLLWNAREELAKFLNVSPLRTIFTCNVSSAINLVASGLRLSSPGEILLTDHEYGAMHWCWELAAQRQGLTIRTFPLPTLATSPDEIIQAAQKAMNPNTRLFFFSHILSPTGLVLPARELCAEARRRGIITVVDGAHAPAMIPLDVSSIGADFYTGNCHKWLLAPTNSGFLILGPGNEDRLQPLQVSWGYRPDLNKLDQQDEFGSTPRIRYLEFEGTRDPAAWLSVPVAIHFQKSLGFDAIRGRIRNLSNYARQRISNDLGLPEATPTTESLSGALTAFRLPLKKLEERVEKAAALRKAIWKHHIEIPIIERSDRLMIRVSTHFYNLESEIDHLAEILPRALEEAGFFNGEF